MKSKIYQTKLTAKGLLASCLTPLEFCKQSASGSEMKKLFILLAIFGNYLLPVNYAVAQSPCTWTTDTVYPVPILDQATVALGTNLYSFAGVSNGGIIASSYKFNGSTWTPIAPLPAALEFPRAVTNGTDIYILGGTNTSAVPQTSVYRYNVGSDTYTTLAPFTTGVWNESVVYLNGKIYKFCGTTSSSASTNVLEIYDITGNNWTTGAPYPLALSFVSAIAKGSFIYAAGGESTSTPSLKTYRYDPVGDTWDDLSIADLPQTRWGAAEGLYSNGFMVAGGYVNGTASANISNTAISWDLGSNTWNTLPNMTGERARMTGAVLNGSFYVIGGRSAASPAFAGTNSNQQYSCCNAVPLITGNSIFCSGSSTILNAGLYAGYSWSTGATTQTISVNTAGTFTVTVTDGNGCTGSASITTTVNANPTPTISGTTVFCGGSSTTLDAGGGYTNYNWSTGATTQTVNVNTAGAFTVTVTNGNGCTGSDSLATIVNPTPDVTVPADTTVCNGTLLPTGTFNFSSAATPGFGGKILIAYSDNASPPTQLRNNLLATPGVIQVDLFNAATGTPSLAIMQQYDMVVPFSNNQYSDPATLGDNLADYVDANGTVVGIGFTFYNSPYGPSGRWLTGNYSPYNAGPGLDATTHTLGTFTAGHPLMAGVSVLTSNYHNIVSVAGGATEVAQWNNGHSLIAFKGRVVGITAYIGSQATWSGDFAKVIVNAGNWLNGITTITWTNNNTTIGLGASGTGNSLPTFTATNNTAAPVTATITVTASYTNAGVTCTDSAAFTITVNPNLTPIISGDLAFCLGSSTTLDAGAGYNGYNWSTGATTQTINVNTPGDYTVTVTDGNGCTGSASVTVTLHLPPPCIMTGGDFCAGGSTQLCSATINSSYLWSTGATTQCITVTSAGIYTVTVTNVSGCTSSCSKIIGTYPAPPCSITGSNFCSGSSSQLCAAVVPGPSGGPYSYLWSTGATTQCITVTTGGTYTVTVTDDGNGCTSSCSKTVTEYPKPTCSITGSDFCSGSGTQLCTSAVPGLSSAYLWSTGATTQCITVTTGGTYTVTVTGDFGCTSSCSKTVTEYPKPPCSITGSDFCSGSSTQLCTSTAPVGPLYTYLWSTGATTQCITVNSGGTYTVTVTDANGCTNSCSKTVTAFSLPVCSITGGNFCQGSSTQLCAATNSGYLWSTGATTQCITVTAGGTYTVTVTNANGCTGSCSKTVTAYPLPTCVISGNIAYCDGSTTQLCGTAGMSAYLWSTGATTQCIAAAGGDYTVTVTNANGCNSSCSITTHLRLLPVCAITGNNFCSGSSSQLCATTAPAGYVFSYAWSTGATTQCITVTTGGTYTVNITNQYGCSSSCSKTITVNPTPVCTISGNIAYCEGSTTQLCGTAGMSSYLWSTGATTQCIAAGGGDYTVTVTNANGCTSSCSITTHLRLLPVCSITGNNFCSGSSSQLCATTAPAGYVFTYAWSTGATTQCITVATGGTYTVNITNQYGCSSSCSKTITVNPTPVCTISGNIAYCEGSTTQLCGTPGMSAYLWSTGATTQCIAAAGGDYTVTVTNSSGCTSSCSITPHLRLLPVCSITGNNFCSGSSSQLCATTAPAGYVFSYIWSTGATTQCITVSTGGTFTVTISNQYGCTSSCSKVITKYPLPTCSITGTASICPGSSAQWCAPAGLAAYLWSNGATTQCITVSTAATYTVTVTNTTGCTKSCSKTLTVKALPACSVTGTASICPGSSTQWCAPAGLAAYLWSNGATTQCITVSTAGTYTVTVTSTGGCTKSCSKTLTIKGVPACSITGTASICPGGATQWCAPAGLAAYLWSNGATTQCISVSSAAVYTVTVTNAGGCTSSCSKALTIKTLPACSITGNSVVSPGQTTPICAPAGLTYLWNNGAATQCRNVAAGTYTVTVTNANGCTNSCSKTVTSAAKMVEPVVIGGDNGAIEASAYPNPFNQEATIEFRNTIASGHIVVELFNLTGSKMAVLFDKEVEQNVTYQTKVHSEDLAEGVYFYRIVSGDNVVTGKLILLKQ